MRDKLTGNNARDFGRIGSLLDGLLAVVRKPEEVGTQAIRNPVLFAPDRWVQAAHGNEKFFNEHFKECLDARVTGLQGWTPG